MMQVLVENAEAYQLFLEWEAEDSRNAASIDKLYEDVRKQLIKQHALPEDISGIITNKTSSGMPKVCKVVYVLGKVMSGQDYFSFRRADLSKGPASLDRVSEMLLSLLSLNCVP